MLLKHKVVVEFDHFKEKTKFNYGEFATIKRRRMAKNKTINVKGTEIVLFNKGSEEYISITDIARYKNAIEPKDVVKNWMRSRSTV